MYPNEGRSLFSDDAVIAASEAAALESAELDEVQELERMVTLDSPPLTSSSLPPTSDDGDTQSETKEASYSELEADDSIYDKSIETLKSIWAMIIASDDELSASPVTETTYSNDSDILATTKTKTAVDVEKALDNTNSIEAMPEGVDEEAKEEEEVDMQEPSTLEAKPESIQNKAGAETDLSTQKEKEEQQEQQPQQLEEEQEQEQAPEVNDAIKNTKVVETQDGEFVVVNKLNKNYEEFDKDDDQIPLMLHTQTSQSDPKAGSRGDRTRDRILGHHHHHYISHVQPPSQNQQKQQQQQQRQHQHQQMFKLENSAIEDPSLEDVVVVDENPFIFAALARQQHYPRIQLTNSAEVEEDAIFGTSGIGNGNFFVERVNKETNEDEDIDNTATWMKKKKKKKMKKVKRKLIQRMGTKDTTTTSPLAPVQVSPAEMPESLRNRGLVPSVNGAHHCTPQFCVNVSLSDDGKFATFHIERPLAETGWISLGIGYAMTMADLLILWPNPTSENGGGPRGAVLSRRSSHAYVEPQLVGCRGHGPLGDNVEEASLHPSNEYVLHNSNPGAAVSAGSVFPDNSKFIVQFTRPVRTKNLDYKLTPGEEQDFCWAYSPKPISADSVADPGAHITQHLSVGSFAMDVGAGQPQLKEVLAKQKLEDGKADAAEKERKKETANKNHNDESGKRISKHQQVGESTKKSKGSESVRPTSWTLKAFSCLVTIAITLYTR
ncbi:hypothetical protein BGX26_001285 [Mortierella sp. AD094]|nr:hypothetical protein BGX26_001285 [Mortierella sp. AD094]